MIEDIVHFTNMEAESRRHEAAPYVLREWIDTCPEEIWAYIGLLIATGVHRSNDVDLYAIYGAKIVDQPSSAQRWAKNVSSC